ncbi:MAG: hypothetical protein P9M08_12170 [Candidatus Erginobacter occultus]|nr:hypothetical protein [Candidatus Erginobacter occultus]
MKNLRTNRKRKSRGLRFLQLSLLPMVSLLVCLIVLEGALGAYRALRRGRNPYGAGVLADYRSLLENVTASADRADAQLPSIAPHPYLGYVANYDARKSHKGMPVNRFGFFSEVEALYRPDPEEEFAVVVLGGSVAAQLCIVGADALRRGLESLPITGGRRVVINSLCQGGYKQPHQLLILSYFLSLGLHADLLINIDGVNEMAFFQLNARQNKIDPSFPWNWLTLTDADRPDREAMRARLAIIRQRESRARLASVLLRTGLYRSVLVRYLRERLDRMSIHREGRAEHRLEERLRDTSRQTPSYGRTGPVYWSGEDLDEALLESARLWRRASIALSDLAREQGIPYVHGLQPNQYFFRETPPPERPDSGVYNTESRFYRALTRGYACFISQSEILRANGVPFVDYNESFFGHVPETIYEDDFAHLNQRGNEMLADAVVESVARLVSPPTGPEQGE